MFWFNKYPYTNTEKFNLDWVISELVKLKNNMLGKDKVTNVISPTETTKVPTSAAVNNFGWSVATQAVKEVNYPELATTSKQIINAINELTPVRFYYGDDNCLQALIDAYAQNKTMICIKDESPDEETPIYIQAILSEVAIDTNGGYRHEVYTFNFWEYDSVRLSYRPARMVATATQDRKVSWAVGYYNLG